MPVTRLERCEDRSFTSRARASLPYTQSELRDEPAIVQGKSAFDRQGRLHDSTNLFVIPELCRCAGSSRVNWREAGRSIFSSFHAALQLHQLAWRILFLILIEARYAVQLESIECCVLRHELNCCSENSAIIGLTP